MTSARCSRPEAVARCSSSTSPMPRDVDPAVGGLPGVTLLDMDDLRAFADAGTKAREDEVAVVRTLLDEELERYLGATSAREVAPMIVALRDRAEEVRSAEVERYRARLGALDEGQLDTVDALTRGIIGKLLHDPSVALKDAAGLDPRRSPHRGVARAVRARRRHHSLLDRCRRSGRRRAGVRSPSGRPSTSRRCSERGSRPRGRDDRGGHPRRPAPRCADLGARRQGRLRQGGPGRRARRSSRPRGPQREGPPVGRLSPAWCSPPSRSAAIHAMPSSARRSRRCPKPPRWPRDPSVARRSYGATDRTCASPASAATCRRGSPRSARTTPSWSRPPRWTASGWPTTSRSVSRSTRCCPRSPRRRSRSSAAKTTPRCGRSSAASSTNPPADASTRSGRSSPSSAATARSPPARTPSWRAPSSVCGGSSRRPTAWSCTATRSPVVPRPSVPSWLATSSQRGGPSFGP